MDVDSIEDLVRSRLQSSHLCGCQPEKEGHCNFPSHLGAKDSKANGERKSHHRAMREGRSSKCSGYNKLPLCRLRIDGPSVTINTPMYTRTGIIFDKLFSLGPSFVETAIESPVGGGNYVAFHRKVGLAALVAPETSNLQQSRGDSRGSMSEERPNRGLVSNISGIQAGKRAQDDL